MYIEKKDKIKNKQVINYILTYVVPVLILELLIKFYNVLDAFIIQKSNNVGLINIIGGAVTVNTDCDYVVAACVIGLFIAYCNNRENAEKTFKSACSIYFIIILVIRMLISKPILYAYDVGCISQILPYIITMSISAAIFVLTIKDVLFLFASGKAYKTLVAIAIGSAVKIILLYMFIIVGGGDIIYCAFADIISRIVIFVFLEMFLGNSLKDFKDDLKIKFDNLILGRMLLVSLAAGIIMMFYRIIYTQINLCISCGDIEIYSGIAVASKIESLFLFLISSIFMSTVLYICTSAKKEKEHIRDAVKSSMIVQSMLILVINIFLYTIGPIIVDYYAKSQITYIDVSENALLYLRIRAIIYFLMSLFYTLLIAELSKERVITAIMSMMGACMACIILCSTIIKNVTVVNVSLIYGGISIVGIMMILFSNRIIRHK